MEEIMKSFYDMWVESEDYVTESAVENKEYEDCKDAIANAIGEKAGCKISDSVTNLACNAEISGFYSGIRYGIMFMSRVLKGGAA